MDEESKNHFIHYLKHMLIIQEVWMLTNPNPSAFYYDTYSGILLNALTTFVLLGLLLPLKL